MPAVPDDFALTHQQAVWQKLCESMENDTEGQRELVAARMRGETEVVYWEGNQPPDVPQALPDRSLPE